MSDIKLFNGNSHFVPNFLLKNFSANNHEQVYYFRFDKRRKLTPRGLVGTRDIFGKKRFYEYDTENYFSKIEGKSAEIFRKISRNEEPDLTEIGMIREFIFRQFIRSPLTEEDIDRAFIEFSNDDLMPTSRETFLLNAKKVFGVDLISLYILNKPLYDHYDSIRNGIYEKAKERLPEAQKMFGFHGANNANSPFGQNLASNFLKDNDVVRVMFSEDSYFLITDSPCIQTGDLLIGGLNITLPFVLPIYPNYALVLGSGREINFLPFFAKVNDEMIVKKINEALVAKAKDGVVSHLQHLPQYIIEAY